VKAHPGGYVWQAGPVVDGFSGWPAGRLGVELHREGQAVHLPATQLTTRSAPTWREGAEYGRGLPCQYPVERAARLTSISRRIRSCTMASASRRGDAGGPGVTNLVEARRGRRPGGGAPPTFAFLVLRVAVLDAAAVARRRARRHLRGAEREEDQRVTWKYWKD
jgi:hypothetical protein